MMMRMFVSSAVIGLFLLSSSVVEGRGSSFLRDVLNQQPSNKQELLNEELLSKAVPLEEYRERLKAKGLRLPMDDSSRRLANYYYYNYNDNQVQQYNDDDQNQAQEEEEEENDDYYVSADNFLDFDGYSLKYAKCQPVERFSAAAVQSGEYSPMVVNDIVILRLCPSYYCSDSRQFGCVYDYAEYAIDLTDYVRIMLRYKIDKEGQLCTWCQYCAGGRRRRAEDYYGYNDDANAVNANNAYGGGYGNGDDAYAGGYANGDDAYAGGYNNGDDANGDDNYSAYPDGCDEYESYCLDEYGASICDEEGDQGDDDEMTAEDYMEYVDCVQVNGGYFVRPRCDGNTDTISIGIYHDRYCSWYAGDQVDVENVGLDSTYFEFAGETGCLDCSQSDEPPYFYANSNLCNRIDITSARCTSSLGEDLFASNDTNATVVSDETECSFIESLRIGTYDANGQLYNDNSLGISRKVTNTQKMLLGVSVLVCIVLAIYSCYLHHAITNLLIKSLSHTDLLPPSRHRRRSRSNSASRRKGGRGRSRRAVTDDDDDDDLEEEFEVKGGATPA